jgi:hypothetical protein
MVVMVSSYLAFVDTSQLQQMVKQAAFEILIAVNGYGNPRGISGFGKYVVAAIDPAQLPTVAFQQTGEILAANPFSHGDIQHLVGCGQRYVLNVHGKAAIDSLMQTHHQFVHGFSLRHASRQGRNFGPESAFFSFMDDNFELHRGTIDSLPGFEQLS